MLTPFLLLTLISSAEFRAQSPEDVPAVSAVRDATESTLADPKALAALQRPGTVLFEDDFESEASLKKYFDIYRSSEDLVRIVQDATVAHRGEGAIEFKSPANPGNSTGAGASGWLGDAGHDRVYFRRYIFFPEDYDQGHLHHTGGGLSGVGSNNKWDGMGSAGLIPKGDEGFSVAFEPWRDWGRVESPGYMFLYTYWVDMKKGKAEGQHWGNMIEPSVERRIVPPRGRWVCLEQMIQVNAIGKNDGEMAAWVDGKLALHLVGFRWRTSEKLELKRFRFGIYVHDAKKENKVWYDDVVVSTGYVGPVVSSEEGLRD